MYHTIICYKLLCNCFYQYLLSIIYQNIYEYKIDINYYNLTSNQVVDIDKGVYYGMSRPENTDGNQCGIVINNATTEHQGNWTCKVYIHEMTLVATKMVFLSGKKNIVSNGCNTNNDNSCK